MIIDKYSEIFKQLTDNLLSKAEDVSSCLSEIQFRTEETEKLSEIIEFLNTQCFYEIW